MIYNLYVDGDLHNAPCMHPLCMIDGKLYCEGALIPHVKFGTQVLQFTIDNVTYARPDKDLWDDTVEELIGFINVPMDALHYHMNMCGVYGITSDGFLYRGRKLHKVVLGRGMSTSRILIANTSIKLKFKFHIQPREDLWEKRNQVMFSKKRILINKHGVNIRIEEKSWHPRTHTGELYMHGLKSRLEHEPVPVDLVRGNIVCSSGFCLLSRLPMYKRNLRSMRTCEIHNLYCHRPAIPLVVNSGEKIVRSKVLCRTCRNVNAYIRKDACTMVKTDTKCMCEASN